MSNENNENNGKSKIWTFKNIALSISVLINITMCYCTIQANVRAKRQDVRAEKAEARAEKLFVSQIKPHIDVKPIKMDPNTDTHATLYFEYLNDSGFHANKVIIDVRFGDKPNEWIGKWYEAFTGIPYKPKTLMSRDRKIGRGTGSIILNKIFDHPRIIKEGGYPIYLWAKWENEYGSSDEVTYKYRLHKTKAVPKPYYYFTFESKTNEKL